MNNPAHATALGIAIGYPHLSLVDTRSVAENIPATRHLRDLFGLIQHGRVRAQTAKNLVGAYSA